MTTSAAASLVPAFSLRSDLAGEGWAYRCSAFELEIARRITPLFDSRR